MAQEMEFRGINAIYVTKYFNQKDDLVNWQKLYLENTFSSIKLRQIWH